MALENAAETLGTDVGGARRMDHKVGWCMFPVVFFWQPADGKVIGQFFIWGNGVEFRFLFRYYVCVLVYLWGLMMWTHAIPI
jgi:hypothetical protein